jgi:hypothetical protein
MCQTNVLEKITKRVLFSIIFPENCTFSEMIYKIMVDSDKSGCKYYVAQAHYMLDT